MSVLSRFLLPPFRTISLFGACSLALFSGTAAATEILVITDSYHPVQSIADARVIELDLPIRIESELAANLSADPATAIALVKHRQREGGPALQRRMTTAYQNVADAWGLGVAKIPAVVVDRSYVVYGDTDVARAITRIDAYRRERP